MMKSLEEILQIAHQTDSLIIRKGALDEVGAVFRAQFPDQRARIISDGNTFLAAGESVRNHFVDADIPQAAPHIFPAEPRLKPDYKHVKTVKKLVTEDDCIPVAVGAGTINDIVKLAAFETNRPYMVVATAASMDGYSSYGAAISHEGVKQNDDCAAPLAIVADLDVITQAPGWLNAAGYGDLVGKVPAGADWILADILGTSQIIQPAWELIQPELRQWIQDPEGVRDGGFQAVEALLEGLIYSGFAMQAGETSRPASGSEHLFSHLWEMQGVQYQGERAPHGFTVGLGTIASAAIYDELVAWDISKTDFDDWLETWPSPEELAELVRNEFTEPRIAQSAVFETLAKHLTVEQLEERTRFILSNWGDIKEKLEGQLMPSERIRELLKTAGCPIHPADFGLSRAQFMESHTRARLIRSRYTVLDLVWELGIEAEMVERLFSPGGFWGDLSE